MLLHIEDLKKYFPIEKGFIFKKTIGYVHAVDRINLSVEEGKTLGLVGESGSGKTTTGKLIVGLYTPTEGRILFEGKNIFGNRKNLQMARRKMGMIFQDPYSSLDPRKTIATIITEPMRIQKVAKHEREKRLYELLEEVGIQEEYAAAYPHELSGGQRQRVAIARALSLKPSLVVADEAVSALDVSIQAQIINLMEDLQKHFNLAYVFISHDLSVVKHISDKVAVMYLGEIVESANTKDLFANPVHPYTKALLSSVPIPGIRREKTKDFLRGEIPSPVNPPKGCRFHTRCLNAKKKCSETKPAYVDIGNEHHVSCYLAS